MLGIGPHSSLYLFAYSLSSVHSLKSGLTADSAALVPKCCTDTLTPEPNCLYNSDLSWWFQGAMGPNCAPFITLY